MANEIISVYQLSASGKRLVSGEPATIRSKNLYLSEALAMEHSAVFFDRCTNTGFADLDKNTVEIVVNELKLNGPEIPEAGVEGKNASKNG